MLAAYKQAKKMSQKAPKSEVIIGRFGRPHGLKGFIKLQLFARSVNTLLQTQPWMMKNEEGQWQAFQIENVEEHPQYVLTKLQGINDRDAASLLTNKEVAIFSDQLPPLKDGDYYWNDLIGLNVINKHGVKLGVVVDLMETGSNDVLVLEDNGKERLIPYLPGDYVLSVDIKNKEMQVDWDEDF